MKTDDKEYLKFLFSLNSLFFTMDSMAHEQRLNCFRAMILGIEEGIGDQYCEALGVATKKAINETAINDGLKDSHDLAFDMLFIMAQTKNKKLKKTLSPILKPY